MMLDYVTTNITHTGMTMERNKEKLSVHCAHRVTRATKLNQPFSPMTGRAQTERCTVSYKLAAMSHVCSTFSYDQFWCCLVRQTTPS